MHSNIKIRRLEKTLLIFSHPWVLWILQFVVLKRRYAAYSAITVDRSVHRENVRDM